jgi:hypothetical protein
MKQKSRKESKMKKKSAFGLAVCLMMSLAAVGTAVTLQFTGAAPGDNNFSTAENWDLNYVPVDKDTIFFAEGSTTELNPGIMDAGFTNDLGFIHVNGPSGVMDDAYMEIADGVDSVYNTLTVGILGNGTHKNQLVLKTGSKLTNRYGNGGYTEVGKDAVFRSGKIVFEPGVSFRTAMLTVNDFGTLTFEFDTNSVSTLTTSRTTAGGANTINGLIEVDLADLTAGGAYTLIDSSSTNLLIAGALKDWLDGEGGSVSGMGDYSTNNFEVVNGGSLDWTLSLADGGQDLLLTVAEPVVLATNLLTGWENRVADATTNATGFSGAAEWGVYDGTSVWSTAWNRWCNDGDFGSQAGGAQQAQGGFEMINDGGSSNTYLRFSITNSTAEAYDLTYVCFDAWRPYDGVQAYSLSAVGGDVTLTNDFSSGELIKIAGLPASDGDDYQDIDIALTALADRTLEPGEHAVFEISFYSPSAAGRYYVDNAAVLGEPSPGFSALESWRLSYFGSALNEGDAADTADPDNDGIKNLMEYAFGLSPTEANDSGALPQPDRDGFNVAVEFFASEEGVAYGTQYCTNLVSGSWLSLTDQGTNSMHHLFLSDLTVTDPLFLRLSVQPQ